MKVLKSFLFLSAALVLSRASFAVEQVYGPLAQDSQFSQFSQGDSVALSEIATEDPLNQKNLENDRVMPEGLAPIEQHEISEIPAPTLGMPSVQEKSVVLNPTEVLMDPPSLDARQKVEAAMAKLEEEKHLEEMQQSPLNPEGMMPAYSAELGEEQQMVLPGFVGEENLAVMPAKKKKTRNRTKLTAEQTAALKAGGAEKEAMIAQLRKEAKDREEAEQAKMLEKQIEAGQIEESLVIAPSNSLAEEESLIVAPVEKKKGGKKKLTAEEIEALKEAGKDKKADRAKAREEALEQAKILDEQIKAEQIAEDEAVKNAAEGSAVAMTTTQEAHPYAILYFTPDGAINLGDTIKKGEDFNNKHMESVPVVIDPNNGDNKKLLAEEEVGQPIIVKGNIDGQEVDLGKEVVAAQQEGGVAVVVPKAGDEEAEKAPTSVTDLVQ